MFKAESARANVMNHQQKISKKVLETVSQLAERFGNDIAYRSDLGYTTAEYAPYTVENFPIDGTIDMAKDLFEKIFKENGYTVLLNNPMDNTLKVQW